MNFLNRLLLNSLALYLTTMMGVGLYFDNPNIFAILIAALILGFVNAVFKPIMTLLTLPFTILSFGLFLFVVNAISISLVAALTPLNVTGFGGALLGALVLSIINAILSKLFFKKNEDSYNRVSYQ